MYDSCGRVEYTGRVLDARTAASFAIPIFTTYTGAEAIFSREVIAIQDLAWIFPSNRHLIGVIASDGYASLTGLPVVLYGKRCETASSHVRSLVSTR